MALGENGKLVAVPLWWEAGERKLKHCRAAAFAWKQWVSEGETGHLFTAGERQGGK